MVVAKTGIKLEKSEVSDKDCPDICHQILGGQGRGLHARAASLSDLAQYVENWTERPVVDRTGIGGLFRIQTEGWAPLRPGPPPAPGAKAEDGSAVADLPTLFEVFERMGLKLESGKAPVEVYVIEHIDRLSGN
ncbi:MAG: TIGR03435 family protein [Acidobacteriota bacterium]|nr:TIGR03435 family protein [Acidobacteriota bacterium]